MSLLLISYILVPIALVLMFKNYKTMNWLWLAFLIGSIFIGVAPFVALAYLVTAYITRNKSKQSSTVSNSSVTYNPDGSYTVYKSEDTKKASSPGKVAFKVVGGVLAGLCVVGGMLFIGLIIAIMTYKPPAGGKEF
jgi:hypothetical protein